jgi:hypothetical protein
MGRISVIRRSQLMQGEIENLRRERVLLRAALADVVAMNADAMTLKRHALRTLARVPAAAPWDGAVEDPEPALSALRGVAGDHA